LAARAARGSAAQVTVLHVTSPEVRSIKASAAKSEAERAFATAAGQQTPTWDFRSVDHSSPVDAVLREAQGYDLIVIGVSEEWGLESNLFGLRPERIAEESPTSMLIVRKHGEMREVADAASPLEQRASVVDIPSTSPK
jgi:nucleotide-binding universal stress UspA family protein